MGLRPDDFSEIRRRMKLRGDAASPARVIGGHAARRAGKAFEIAILAAALRQRDVVALRRLPDSGAKFVGRGEAIPQKIPCDFIGCLVKTPSRGAAPLFFDAKHFGDKIASLDLADVHLVKRHQARFLYEQAEAGAVAGLLVQCRRGIGWLEGKHLGPQRARRTWEDPAWVWLEGIDFALMYLAHIHKTEP